MTEQERIEADFKTMYGGYTNLRDEVVKIIEAGHGTVGSGDDYEDILVDHLNKEENAHVGFEFLRLRDKLIEACDHMEVVGLTTRFKKLHSELEQKMGKALRGKITPDEFATSHKELKTQMDDLARPDRRKEPPELKPFPELPKHEKRP
ncbi:MAG: hypothetical protein KAW41_03630 [Candidatus Diapherotrites archaeon]|nr:hypothetical protein [Candidatus Diapherotrites archaeon]